MADTASRSGCARHAESCGAGAPNGDYRFRLGSAYKETGHYSEAVDELTRAAKYTPNNATIWTTLAQACEQTGATEQAKSSYQRALSLNPKDNAVRNSYGTFLVASGAPEDGLREFQRILEQDPATFTRSLTSATLISPRARWTKR